MSLAGVVAPNRAAGSSGIVRIGAGEGDTASGAATKSAICRRGVTVPASEGSARTEGGPWSAGWRRAEATGMVAGTGAGGQISSCRSCRRQAAPRGLRLRSGQTRAGRTCSCRWHGTRSDREDSERPGGTGRAATETWAGPTTADRQDS